MFVCLRKPGHLLNGNNFELGPCVLGSEVELQPGSYMYSNVTVEDDVVLTPGSCPFSGQVLGGGNTYIGCPCYVQEEKSKSSAEASEPRDLAPCVIDAVNQAAHVLARSSVDRPTLAEHIRSCASTQRLVTQLRPVLDQACSPRSYQEVEADLHRTGQPFPAVVAAHAMGVLWDVPVILCGEDYPDGNPGERLRVGSDKEMQGPLVIFRIAAPSARGVGHMQFDNQLAADAVTANLQDISTVADAGAAARFACEMCGKLLHDRPLDDDTSAKHPISLQADFESDLIQPKSRSHAWLVVVTALAVVAVISLAMLLEMYIWGSEDHQYNLPCCSSWNDPSSNNVPIQDTERMNQVPAQFEDQRLVAIVLTLTCVYTGLSAEYYTGPQVVAFIQRHEGRISWKAVQVNPWIHPLSTQDPYDSSCVSCPGITGCVQLHRHYHGDHSERSGPPFPGPGAMATRIPRDHRHPSKCGYRHSPRDKLHEGPRRAAPPLRHRLDRVQYYSGPLRPRPSGLANGPASFDPALGLPSETE